MYTIMPKLPPWAAQRLAWGKSNVAYQKENRDGCVKRNNCYFIGKVSYESAR